MRLFISYAHETAEHQNTVRDLWLFLRANGFDARLDLVAAEQRQDWTRWMQRELRDADFVLVVASPEYKRRAEGDASPDEGRGVQWEAALIREEYYADRESGLRRILPVVLPGQSAAGIPAWLGPTMTTNYEVREFTVPGAERLIRYLSGQPYEVAIPLGTVPVLVPRGTNPPSSSDLRPDGPLRTEVLLQVGVDGGELVTEVSVAGTVLGSRRAPLDAALRRPWPSPGDPPGLAAARLAEAGRRLAGSLLGTDAQFAIGRLIFSLSPGSSVDVVLAAADGVVDLPVELLRLPSPGGDDPGPLCLLPGVTVARRIPTGNRPAPAAPAGPVKILAAIAAPDETKTRNAPLDVEAEMKAMLDAVSALPDAGAQVRILEVASLGQIRAALADDEYHVLHLSAHGSPDTIELADEDGHPVPVAAGDLIGAIKRAGRPVPLIVLSACSGGAGGSAGMAAGLVAQGADRVIAMQTGVTDTYATALAKALYRALGEHPDRSVARALADARQEVEVEARAAAGAGRLAFPEFGVATLFTWGPDPAVLDVGAPARPLTVATRQLEGHSVRELPIGYLIGRRPQLRTAMRVLRREPAAVDEFGVVAGVALCGPGGIGKTALTGRVISRLADDGWVVALHEGAWNPANLFAQVTAALAARPDLVHADVAAAVAALGDPEVPDLAKVPALGVLLRSVRLLLVLDDFEQNLDTGGSRFLDAAASDALADLAGAARTGALLFTCRYPIPGLDANLARIDVPALSEAEQRRLFLRLPKLRDLDPDDRRLVADMIGGHPRLIEFVDALLRGGRVNLHHISGKLRGLADHTGISLRGRRDLRTAAEQAMLLGVADILLADLQALVVDDLERRVLRQVCVCRAPMSVADLAVALAGPPDDSRTSDPEDGDAVVDAVQALTNLTLLGSEQIDDPNPESATVGILPWIADHVEGADPVLTDEHERALAMHYRRFADERGRYEDLVEIPRHLARLGRYGELADAAQQATQVLDGTLAVAAYLAEIRPLVPVDERSWLLVNDLEQQNFLAVGDLTKATDLSRQAYTIVEKQAAADPDDTGLQRDLSVSHNKVGDVAVAVGDLPAAGAAYAAGLAIAERLAAADPGNAGWQRDLSVSHEKLGNVAVAAGDLPAAGAAYAACLAIAERLAAADPDNAEWQRDLSISHNKLGNVAMAVGDLPAARAAYAADLAIAERLAAADPGNAGWQRDLSVSHTKVGDVAVAAGDLAAARAAYAAGVAIAERLAAADPGNAGWQRDLSVSHTKVGDVAVAAGDLPAARAAYTGGLAIRERLVAADPGNAGWQRDLSVSHNKVGDVAVAAGDLPAARAAYAAGLMIRERLAGADPGNAGWQRDLSVSHTKMGDVAVAAGDLAAARAAYAAGVAIAERLAAADPSNAQWQADLSYSRAKVAEIADAEKAGAGTRSGADPDAQGARSIWRWTRPNRGRRGRRSI